MKIPIKQRKSKLPIAVRRISPQQLCEEQLNRINERIRNINANLRSI